MVFSAFPRSACHPASRATRTSRHLVGQLERTGCIADYTHIWWDIRPHPRLGTIELRICDAVSRVEDAVALAAYFQALVKMLCERSSPGGDAAASTGSSSTENKWLAARYGLAAPVIDLVTGRRNRVPISQLDPADPPRRSSRTLASSAPSASPKGSPRSSPAATAPRASSASGTRTATSPRSLRRSAAASEIRAGSAG